MTPTFLLRAGTPMPILGFGSWEVGQEAVESALAAGYRSIDTAAAYGNEDDVGRAIQASGLARDQLFVTTKVPNDSHGYDATRRAFEGSLTRLGLEFVDLYLIHWPRPELGLYVETWRALEDLQSVGLAREIGVSNFTPEQIDRLVAEGHVLPAVNQVELHPQKPQDDLRRYNAAHQIVTEAWSPLDRGRGLLDRPIVKSIAARHGRTAAQIVLRWHVQLGIVAIPRSSSPRHIRENLDLFDFTLSEAEMAELPEKATAAFLQ